MASSNAYRPPVYFRLEKNGPCYPNVFRTIIDPKIENRDNKWPRMLEDWKFTKERYNGILDLIDYYRSFHELANLGHYLDIHDISFQDLALRIGIDWNDNQWRSLDSIAIIRLNRARSMAISSRNDLDWNGKPIVDAELQYIKQQEMESFWSFLELTDWAAVDQSTLSKEPGIKTQIISVVSKDTQLAVEEMTQKYEERFNSSQICILNMANAHHIGGGYQYGIGSQEEIVGGNTNMFITLGNVGEVIERRIHYQKGWHIPPGGNYFHKARFLTGKKVDCMCITHPMADFRRGEERNEGEDFKTGTEEYFERIKIDMYGILRQAKEKKIEVLILSATGCGAFKHDPTMEAQTWKKVLAEDEFQGHFTEVLFAILGDYNFQTFKQCFSKDSECQV